MTTPPWLAGKHIEEEILAMIERRRRTIRLIRWALIVLPLVLIPACYCFIVRPAFEAAESAHCNNTFKQLGLAMHNYHDAHGHFVPAYLADREGRPMNSWRILVLPYMEYGQAFARYNLKTPWNDPRNLGFMERPSEFVCPSDWNADKNNTSEVLIVGPGTAFDGPKTVRLKDIADGSAHTILAGEISESGIHWMAPRDLDVREMSFKINDEHRFGLRSNHPRGVSVLFADGSASFLRHDISPALLKALTTINGGEDASAFTNR
jgi:prepilin-type processing-associated H-X9-DG protein